MYNKEYLNIAIHYSILLKIVLWVEPTFGTAITVTTIWYNLVPIFGTFVIAQFQMLARHLTIIWLKILQHHKLVQSTTQILTVYFLKHIHFGIVIMTASNSILQCNIKFKNIIILCTDIIAILWYV